VPIYQGGHDPGLFHPSGVPSFTGFAGRIQPGCCDSGLRATRVANVHAVIQSDVGLTPDNRQLALDMANHFVQFGNTTCRNCGLGWGIYLVIDAILIFAVFRGADGIGVGGGLVSTAGVGLLACYSLALANDRKSAKALQERERAALDISGEAGSYGPLLT
jgi:hypothetical protein